MLLIKFHPSLYTAFHAILYSLMLMAWPQNAAAQDIPEPGCGCEVAVLLYHSGNQGNIIEYGIASPGGGWMLDDTLNLRQDIVYISGQSHAPGGHEYINFYYVRDDGNVYGFDVDVRKHIHIAELTDDKNRLLTFIPDPGIKREPQYGDLYYALESDGETHVLKLNMDTGVVTPILTTPHPVTAMAIDYQNKRLFYAVATQGLFTWNMAGGETTLFLEIEAEIPGIAMHHLSETVYWTQADGYIRRASYDGLEVKIILDNLHNPFDIRIDWFNNHLYWSEPENHRIRRSGTDGGFIIDYDLGDDEPKQIVLIYAMQVSLESESGYPTSAYLAQNYPNPFNPITVISYEIAEEAEISLSVYDMTGRKVTELVNARKQPGRYNSTFDAFDLASGVYLARLTVADAVLTRKMILVK